MKKDYYVYTHKTKDTHEVFYVGVGSGNRAFTKNSRNIYWHRKTKKHGFDVEILIRDLCLYEAYKIEIELIRHYGRDSLCNLTDGGDGVKNPSSEARKKMSDAKKGKTQKKDHIKKRVEAIRSNTNRVNKSSSGFRGVVWHKKSMKWMAQASVDGRCVYLGLYDCKFEAWLKVMKYKGKVAV